MIITDFHRMVSSENAARRFVLGYCWKNHQRFCPRCRARKLYRIQDHKRRCARCGYTFHDYSQRFLAGCWRSPQQWLWFLKLFELDVKPRRIAQQLQCTYATVLKAQDVTRHALLAQALDAQRLYAHGLAPGPRRSPSHKVGAPPIFGLIEINGYAVCDFLPDITPDELLHYKLAFHLKTAAVGQVVYTAPYQHYTALLGCGPEFWPTNFITHADTNIPADGQGFWPFAKARLKQLRGLPPAHFPLHLKEWECRYNHRDNDLFTTMVEAVCAFVPRPDAQAGGHPVIQGKQAAGGLKAEQPSDHDGERPAATVAPAVKASPQM